MSAVPSLIQPHICLDERGVPYIAGTTTKVIEIVLNKQGSGATPEELAEDLPHLTLAQIYAALAYYYDHKAEIDAQIERDIQEVEELRRQAGESPFVRRLKVEGKLPQ